MNTTIKKTLLMAALGAFLTTGIAGAADKQPYDNPPPPQGIHQDQHKDLKDKQPPAPKPKKEKKEKKHKKIMQSHQKDRPVHPDAPK